MLHAALCALAFAVVNVWLSACGPHHVTLPKDSRHPERPKTDFDEPIYGAERDATSGKQAEPLLTVSPDRAATSDEQEAIARIMVRTERSRGLRFLRTVPVRVQSEEHMAQVLTNLARTQGFHLQRAYNTAVALGLWNGHKSLKAFIGEAGDVQVAGYYNHRDKTLVIRNDLAVALVNPVSASARMEMTATLIHELVHALQDQHFGLGEHIEQHRTTDAQEAYMALIEGDATLTMMHYQIQRVGISFPSMLADEQLFNTFLGRLPRQYDAKSIDNPVSSTPLLFRYAAGARFAGSVVRESGLSGLGAVYARPPTSTQLVLDYPAYLSNRVPLSLRRIPTQALAARGYHVLNHDTLGRVYLSGFLQQSGIGGDLLAEGWEADRIVTFKRGDHVGSMWIIAMSRDEQASAVAERARVSLERTLENGQACATGTSLRTAYVINNVSKRDLPALQSALENWLHSGRAF